MDKVERLQLQCEQPTDPHLSVQRRRLPAWIARPCRWCWTGLRRAAQFLLVAWAALAIYYSNLPWFWARVALAVAFAGLGVWPCG
jgi:hypothetical protein